MCYGQLLAMEVRTPCSVRSLRYTFDRELTMVSLPGAIVMFALSLAVGSVQDQLPLPVYAILSGLNAASVGIITLAAVEVRIQIHSISIDFADSFSSRPRHLRTS